MDDQSDKDGAFSICHICLKKEMIITIYFTYLNDQRSEKKRAKSYLHTYSEILFNAPARTNIERSAG